MQDYLKEIFKCVKCGTCTTSCPIYKEEFLEQSTARGKLTLIKALNEEEEKFSPKFEKVIHKCVQCLKCEELCPNDIPINTILILAWEKLAKIKTPIYSKKILLEKVLPNPVLFKSLILFNKIFGKLIFNFSCEKSLMELKPLIKKFYPRSFPKISKSIFRFNNFPPLNNSKNKIGFFTGCMIDYFYPKIGLSLVNFFKNNNWEVVIPQEQTCCGLPLFSLGNPSLAKKFILKNLEVFEKLKLNYIVFACPSCLGTMKVKLKILLNEEELKRFENLIKSFIDFSQIFALFNFKYKKLDKNMLYHFSCHLNRQVKIKEELKETIAYLGGEKIKLVEDLCCGFGGVFNFDYYDLSMKINHRLIKVIQEDNPQIVLSSCPGCIFQIESGLRKENINNLKVKHLVEAL